MHYQLTFSMGRSLVGKGSGMARCLRNTKAAGQPGGRSEEEEGRKKGEGALVTIAVLAHVQLLWPKHRCAANSHLLCTVQNTVPPPFW